MQVKNKGKKDRRETQKLLCQKEWKCESYSWILHPLNPAAVHKLTLSVAKYFWLKQLSDLGFACWISLGGEEWSCSSSFCFLLTSPPVLPKEAQRLMDLGTHTEPPPLPHLKPNPSRKATQTCKCCVPRYLGCCQQISPSRTAKFTVKGKNTSRRKNREAVTKIKALYYGARNNAQTRPDLVVKWPSGNKRT